jgi:dTDP-4-amino-4,6-dideoxygalactose transaminase
MNAAYLWAQLELADKITRARLARWEQYNTLLQPLKDRGIIELPFIPEGCVHNAHMYYIKTKDINERSRFIDFMKQNGIWTVFHYIPLHTAPAGMRFGTFYGEDVYTTKESERLVRLPMFYSLKESEVDYIVDKVKEFYRV